MARRVHSEEEILRVLREAESGDTVVEVCRKHRISQQSFYLWTLTGSAISRPIISIPKTNRSLSKPLPYSKTILRKAFSSPESQILPRSRLPPCGHLEENESGFHEPWPRSILWMAVGLSRIRCHVASNNRPFFLCQWKLRINTIVVIGQIVSVIRPI
jgi:hypothetical protein